MEETANAGPVMTLISEVTVLLGDPTLPDPTKREGRFHEEDLECVDRLRSALDTLTEYRFAYVDRHADLIDRFAAEPPAFVLNFCDTGFRNRPVLELSIAAFLEMLDVPYSGASPFSMVLAYDKAIVRLIAADLAIPVPEQRFVEPAAIAGFLPEFYPCLIKPNYGDGSVGITQDAVVRNDPEARRYLDMLHADLPDRAVLVQEYLPGPEYGFGLIGNPKEGLHALPPLEVDFSGLDTALPPILSFESKTTPDSPYWTDIRFRAADLDAAARERMEKQCSQLFERLGCRDYARFDFRADATGTLKLLEVNPNPAWAHDGKLAMMAGFAGYNYPGMLALLLSAAQRRIAGERR